MVAMRDQLEAFVASLAIPADRKAVVLAELIDHVACAREQATRDGKDADEAERAVLGNLEALRHSFEAVEPAFTISRLHALVRGVVAGTIVALVLAFGGEVMTGIVGAVFAVAVAIVFAPPRVLELLRAELRARRAPFGPAITYAMGVHSTPFVIWIGMVVARALHGITDLDVTPSAFAITAFVWGVVAIEAIRVRRRVTA